jgi:hypothetical protein
MVEMSLVLVDSIATCLVGSARLLRARGTGTVPTVPTQYELNRTGTDSTAGTEYSSILSDDSMHSFVRSFCASNLKFFTTYSELGESLDRYIILTIHESYTRGLLQCTVRSIQYECERNGTDRTVS